MICNWSLLILWKSRRAFDLSFNTANLLRLTLSAQRQNLSLSRWRNQHATSVAKSSPGATTWRGIGHVIYIERCTDVRHAAVISVRSLTWSCTDACIQVRGHLDAMCVDVPFLEMIIWSFTSVDTRESKCLIAMYATSPSLVVLTWLCTSVYIAILDRTGVTSVAVPSTVVTTWFGTEQNSMVKWRHPLRGLIILALLVTTLLQPPWLLLLAISLTTHRAPCTRNSTPHPCNKCRQSKDRFKWLLSRQPRMLKKRRSSKHLSVRMELVVLSRILIEVTGNHLLL